MSPRRAVVREVLVVVSLLIGPGCSSLPPATLDACGDGIVEPALGEDCDRATADCGAPDSALACRLLCATTADCPATATCGRGGACAIADGRFGLASETAWTSPFLLVGDVDGDRAPDLIGVDDVAVELRAGLGGGGFAAARSLPSFPATGSPLLADLTGDGIADVALSVGFGVHVLSSAVTGDFQATFQPSAPIGLSGGPLIAGVVPIPFGGLPTGQVIAVARVPAGPECPLPQGCDVLIVGEPGGVAILPKRLEWFASTRLPLAPIANPPANERQFVIALPFVDDPDQLGDQSGLYLVRVHQTTTATRLDPIVEVDVPGAVDGVTFTDLDGDGELDLLIAYTPTVPANAGAEVAVALSNGTAPFDAPRTLVMRPFGEASALPRPVPAPIAWGDLDGDGRDELISRDGAWSLACAPPSCSGGRIFTAAAPWAEAAVGDVNGDGHRDLIASRRAGATVDIALGTSVFGLWNDASFAAPGQVRALRLGDFDGNQVTDVAIAAIGSDGEDAELVVGFGQVGAPLAAPVSMGTIGKTLALEPLFVPAAGRFDLADDLVLAFDRDGARSISFMFGAVGRRMIAPFLPSDDEVPDGGYTTVDVLVAVELDGDPASEAIALLGYHDGDGVLQAVHARALDANRRGDLVERDAGTLPQGMFTGSDFAEARWASVPSVDGSAALLLGAEASGRVIALPIEGCPAACQATRLRVLQPAVLGRTPTDLAVLDLDGQGALDVVVPTTGVAGSAVLIWRGGVGEPEIIAVPDGARPVGVTAVRSVVGAPARLVVAIADGGVLVGEPDGAGRYLALVPLALGPGPDGNQPRAVGVRATDADGDGLDDLLVVTGPDPRSPRGLKVYLQQRVPGGPGLAQREAR